jgi:hypothetical protein
MVVRYIEAAYSPLISCRQDGVHGQTQESIEREEFRGHVQDALKHSTTRHEAMLNLKYPNITPWEQNATSSFPSLR